MIVFLIAIHSAIAGNNSVEIVGGLIPSAIFNHSESQMIFDFSKKTKTLVIHDLKNLKALTLSLASCLARNDEHSLCGSKADPQDPFFDAEHTDAHLFLTRSLEWAVKKEIQFEAKEIMAMLQVSTVEIQERVLKLKFQMNDRQWVDLASAIKVGVKMTYYIRALSDPTLSKSTRALIRKSMHHDFVSQRRFIPAAFEHRKDFAVAGIQPQDLNYLCGHRNPQDQEAQIIFEELKICGKKKS